jgi:hypothetical protein
MQVTLNDKPVQVAAACVTLHDLLAYVEDELLPRGQVITEIEVDGIELDDDDDVQALERSLAGVQSVAFRTTRAVDLAREGLEQAVELLPQLSDALRESAHLLRSGETAAGLDLLYECLGHVEWYIGLIAALDIYFSELSPEGEDDLLGDTHLDGRTISVPGGIPLKFGGDGNSGELRTFASVENLRTRLVEAQRLQQSEEMRKLADLLEHEVMPIARLWAREAPMLLRRVAREGAVA